MVSGHFGTKTVRHQKTGAEVSAPNFFAEVSCAHALPTWPSGQSDRPPCAVERDVLRGQGSRPGLGMSAAYYRFISNNSYTHDDQGVNPRQEKEGSTMSSIN